jgi:type II secretory ATPase GspE/PulE/Tfp pilus assembly ATPase PilB-like protein
VVAACGWAPGETYRLARGRGCPSCYDSGYQGRLAIHELLDIDEGMQQRIVAATGLEDLRAYAGSHGHKDLYADGMERVLAGATTPEEIARAIHMQ